MAEIDSEILDGGHGQGGSEIVHSVVQFLRMAWYRRTTLIATLVVVGLLGGLYAATATRYYQAQASILILQNGGDELVPSMSAAMSNQDVMPTYQQLVTKAVVLDGAVSRLRPEHLVDLRGKPREKWVAILANNLNVQSIRRTKLLEIKYRSLNPDVAVAVTQAVIDSYLEFIDRTHRGTAHDVIEVLRHEKDKVQKNLREKQTELLAVRQGVGDIGVRAGGHVLHPIVQTAISLNEALIESQKQRMEYQATLEAIQNAVQKGEDLQQHILAVEEVVGREILMAGLGFNQRDARVQAELEKTLLTDGAELRALSEHYGPAHPRLAEIQHRIRSTQQYLQAYQQRVTNQLTELQSNQLGPMLVQMLQQSVSRAYQHEMSLRASFEEARQSAIAHEGSLAKVELLERDVTRLQRLEDVLIEQIAKTDLRQENGDVRATVVEAPEADKRAVWPRLPVIAALCLIIATLLGATVVYVQDILDDRFRTADELSMRLGVQVLAMVRRLDDTHGEGMESILSFISPHTAATESFRTLRTALAFHGNDTERLVISSSEPGDGKTTVLANLAVTLAQAGKKTLLIDADLRRPGLTAMVDMKAMPGLSDVLHSEAYVDESVEDHIVRTDLEHLDILPAGPRRPNPSELLAGDRMGELLAWADANYDQILIDSPPALVATDTALIGRLVDGVIMVVRPEKNRRRLVTRAVETFNSLGIHVTGIVANCIEGESGKSYGFDYGYGYGYGEGYEYGSAEHDNVEDKRHPEAAYDDVQIHPMETFGTENSVIVPRKAG